MNDFPCATVAEINESKRIFYQKKEEGEIDEKLLELCEFINSLDGIATRECCQGHRDRNDGRRISIYLSICCSMVMLPVVSVVARGLDACRIKYKDTIPNVFLITFKPSGRSKGNMFKHPDSPCWVITMDVSAKITEEDHLVMIDEFKSAWKHATQDYTPNLSYSF